MTDEVLFSVVDPRRIIVDCFRNQWFTHILVSHPEMNGFEGDVIQAIQTPLFICSDNFYQNRNVYYLKNSRNYTKIVVELVNGRGSVVTAFFTLNTKQGERFIWPPSSH